MAEDEPGAVVEQEAETPEQTPVSAPADGHEAAPDQDVDDQAVQDEKGRKMVPLEAVQKERKEKRELKGKVETLQSQIEQARAFQQQATPVLQALQARQDLIDALRSGQPVQSGKSPNEQLPTADPELEQVAKTLDLYDSSGKPDLERAKTLQSLIQRQAETLVEAKVKPLAERTAIGHSSANYERLKNTTLADGSKVDPQIFDYWWNALGAENTQDPNVAATALLQAIGHHQLSGKPFIKPAARVGAPLMIDNAGGRHRGPVTLSSDQKNVAKELGVSAADFQKTIETAMQNDGILEDL